MRTILQLHYLELQAFATLPGRHSVSLILLRPLLLYLSLPVMETKAAGLVFIKLLEDSFAVATSQNGLDAPQLCHLLQNFHSAYELDYFEVGDV